MVWTSLAAAHVLVACRGELLAIEHGHVDGPRIGQPLALGDLVEAFSRPRGVQQRRQHVRLAPAEGTAKLQHAVVRALPGQARQHLFEQPVQVGGDVGGREEGIRVAIDLRRCRIAGGIAPRIDGEHGIGQVAGLDIRMEFDQFGPGFEGVDAHLIDRFIGMTLTDFFTEPFQLAVHFRSIGAEAGDVSRRSSETPCHSRR